MSPWAPASGTDIGAVAPGDTGGAPMRRRGLMQRQPALVGGLACLVVIFVTALGAPWWGTVDPTGIHPISRLREPSAESWFGTDQYGRDIYSRTLYGGRISLLVGITVSAVSVAIGVGIGLVTGYYRRVDAIVMRVMDG